MPEAPLTLVVYGKGGVGKSTVCSHLAVSFARKGRRVLLLGCDPKADASARLLGGRRPPTIVDMVTGTHGGRFKDLAQKCRPGLDVIETGGPQPGQGCGGRGVATLCQFLEENAREVSRYDTLIFDVLGDLVCGGFVAPLRFSGRGDVYMVSSEETASLFAANNIAAVASSPLHAGVELGGIVFNLREDGARRDVLESFAARLGAPVAGVLPRDRSILESEERCATVFDLDPGGAAAARFDALAELVASRRLVVPGASARPLSNEDFREFVRRQRGGRP